MADYLGQSYSRPRHDDSEGEDHVDEEDEFAYDTPEDAFDDPTHLKELSLSDTYLKSEFGDKKCVAIADGRFDGVDLGELVRGMNAKNKLYLHEGRMLIERDEASLHQPKRRKNKNVSKEVVAVTTSDTSTPPPPATSSIWSRLKLFVLLLLLVLLVAIALFWGGTQWLMTQLPPTVNATSNNVSNVTS